MLPIMISFGYPVTIFIENEIAITCESNIKYFLSIVKSFKIFV